MKLKKSLENLESKNAKMDEEEKDSGQKGIMQEKKKVKYIKHERIIQDFQYAL